MYNILKLNKNEFDKNNYNTEIKEQNMYELKDDLNCRVHSFGIVPE